MKKKIAGCVLFFITQAVCFATQAYKGEKWEIEYLIIWEDTGQEYGHGTLTCEPKGQITLEKWARQKVGFKSDFNTKKIEGKMLRLILDIRRIEP